jgi:hypothetical protein
MNVATKVVSELANGPKTVGELATAVGAHAQSVRVALWALKRSGQVVKSCRSEGNDDKRRCPYLWQLAAVEQAA